MYTTDQSFFCKKELHLAASVVVVVFESVPGDASMAEK